MEARVNGSYYRLIEVEPTECPMLEEIDITVSGKFKNVIVYSNYIGDRLIPDKFISYGGKCYKLVLYKRVFGMLGDRYHLELIAGDIDCSFKLLDEIYINREKQPQFVRVRDRLYLATKEEKGTGISGRTIVCVAIALMICFISVLVNAVYSRDMQGDKNYTAVCNGFAHTAVIVWLLGAFVDF
jgi:hypothetical protein